MEVLFFILIVIFAILSGKSKQKKKPQTPAGAATAPKAVKARAKTTVWPKITVKQDDIAKMLSGWVDDEAEAAGAPANVKPVQVAGQKSPVVMAGDIPREAGILDEVDEEGCVGGSMAHTHDEGESRAEHHRHVEEARRQENEETRAAQAARELSEMNLRRLRQAVVMAEILDRPKALRRNHRVG